MTSSAPAAWPLRLAGLCALVNGVGFGGFDIPAIWHFQHHHTVWQALDNPTYGHGPFDAHGIPTTTPLLLAFLGACLVLAIGGALLLIRRTGTLITLTGLVLCMPFWWGFNLPFAWITAILVPVLLAVAWTARRNTPVAAE